ncbi:MAG: TonB-dependent receptor, partial [Novosphingobium sp.]|nr:TonB-dependent receptor [Novosphingobium sp.]
MSVLQQGTGPCGAFAHRYPRNESLQGENDTVMRSHLFYAATALGTVLTTPALAQGTEDAGPGDIVVTARRVEERLQDVPISITVYNQQALSNRNIVTPTDLATYTPSLTVNQRYGPEKASFVIRGFTQEANTSPSVGTYFADVVAARAQTGTTSGNGAGAGSLFDLQNVQVLKGPQGTLFGRNTTGGAVLLVPQKPTDRLEGYVEGSIGDYNMWRTEAVVNIPLADTFRVRLGIDRNKRDGYMKNQSGIGGKDFNDVNYFAFRASMVADLTPDLENYTIFSYNNSFSRGYGSKIGLCLTPGIVPAGANPGWPAFAYSSGQARTAPAACAQIARQNAHEDGVLDVDISNPNPFLRIRQWQVINTTTWKASDTLTIKNIASYTEFREASSFSLNGDNFFIPAGQTGVSPSLVGLPFYYVLLQPAPNADNAAQSTFTEELQFQGNTSDGSLVWQAGAYLEVSNPLGWSEGFTPSFSNCSDVVAPVCTTPFAGVGNYPHSRTKTYWNNKGFYAQATYKITDQFSVTGGIRYTIDRVTGAGESRRIRFATTGSANTAPFAPTCNDPRIVGVATTPDFCHRAFTEKSEKPTWLIDVDYKPLPDVMLYAKWARGYRQGGVNMTNIGLETWGPEKVDTYEIGAKASWRGDSFRGYFNIAAFYNDFRDQQITGNLIAKPDSGLTGGAAIINAGKSKIQGIEVDTSVTLFNDLRFDLGYTYLDTKLLEVTRPTLDASSPFSDIIPTAVVGQPLSFSPKHRLTATATYTLPLDDKIGKISVGATYVYTAKQWASHTDDVISWTGAGCPTPAGSTTPTCSVPVEQVFGFNPGLLPATNIWNINVSWNEVLGQPVDAAF